ncbi:Hypothetical protein SRAE_2000490400 [Strongyloides ratti]|uniref:C2 domain-containing protein n=1 Tax=Strongyloides ratti TaxID=34506 RepID=A0A090LRS4_STRRB|nr:Hypothetical protein SRAE_2000490400 [Strongyloides ratti]CEF70271.1 Hypothetical protein SRAE_2000490400 [Strongyloides ratti]
MYFENITENDLSISSTVLGVNSVYNISTICDVSNLIQSFWSLSINSSFINVILKGECFIASIALEKKLQKCFWCTKTTKIIENFKNWNESNFTIYFPFEYILIVLIVIILIFFAITITLLNLLIKDKLSDNICISMKSYKIQNYNITMTTDSKFNKLFFKDNFKESSKKEDILIKHNTKNVKTCLKNYSLNQDISTSILKPYISTQNVYQQKSISNDKKFLPKIQFNESIKSSNSRVQSWINYREMWNTNIYCNTSPTKFNETGTSLFGGAVGYSDTPISSRNVLNNYF